MLYIYPSSFFIFYFHSVVSSFTYVCSISHLSYIILRKWKKIAVYLISRKLKKME